MEENTIPTWSPGNTLFVSKNKKVQIWMNPSWKALQAGAVYFHYLNRMYPVERRIVIPILKKNFIRIGRFVFTYTTIQYARIMDQSHGNS